MTEPATIAIQAPVLTPSTETAAIIHMIERAARDPAVDLDKLQRLIEMRSAIHEKEAAIAFDAAMSLAQSEMRAIATDSSNPQTRSKYASYYAIDKALRPIYTKHGLSLSFNTAPAATDASVRVLCRVATGGYGREYQIDMPADGKGAKGGDVMTRTHATGSAVTYGMRYLLKMIFNVAIGEGDDDGNGAAKGAEYISEQQAQELAVLLENTGGDVAKFCNYAQVESLPRIPADHYQAAVAKIKSAGKDRAAKAKKDAAK